MALALGSYLLLFNNIDGYCNELIRHVGAKSWRAGSTAGKACCKYCINPDLLKYTEIKGQMGISKEMQPSRIPGAMGDVGGGAVSEFGGTAIQNKVEKMAE